MDLGSTFQLLANTSTCYLRPSLLLPETYVLQAVSSCVSATQTFAKLYLVFVLPGLVLVGI